MFISEFRITNYLSHQNCEADLKPLTVFVGPCNSGKSAFFDALTNFSLLARGKLSTPFSPGPFSFASTRTRQSGQNGQIGFSCKAAPRPASPDFVEYSISYRQIYGNDEDPRYEILSERLNSRHGDRVKELYDRAVNRLDQSIRQIRSYIGSETGVLAALRQATSNGVDLTNVDDLVVFVAKNVSRIVKYRMQSYYLRQPTFVSEDETDEVRIRPNGEGLAGALFRLSQAGGIEYDEIRQSMRRTIVGFDDFVFNQTRSQEIGFSIRFNDGRGIVSAARLSDGTLHFLGLVTLLLNPSKPSVICLEEPEVGLNSAAITELVRLLKAATTLEHAPLQILVSTHSPYLLRTLWNHGLEAPLDSVLYTRIENGVSRLDSCRALQGINHFDVNNMSISFAANLLDGMVNPPE